MFPSPCSGGRGRLLASVRSTERRNFGNDGGVSQPTALQLDVHSVGALSTARTLRLRSESDEANAMRNKIASSTAFHRLLLSLGVALACVAGARPALAAVNVMSLFSDHMVVQRDM